MQSLDALVPRNLLLLSLGLQELVLLVVVLGLERAVGAVKAGIDGFWFGRESEPSALEVRRGPLAGTALHRSVVVVGAHFSF